MLLFDEFPFFLALIPNFRQMILINYQQWCKVDHTSWLHFFDYMQFSFQFICGEEDYITNHDVGTRNSNEDYSTYPSPLSVRTDCLQLYDCRIDFGSDRICSFLRSPIARSHSGDYSKSWPLPRRCTATYRVFHLQLLTFQWKRWPVLSVVPSFPSRLYDTAT